MTMSTSLSLINFVDLSQPSWWIAFVSIAFNPLFWNIVARWEYHTKGLTRLAGGNPYLGCYGLAVTIFSLGLIRDYLFSYAIQHQPVIIPSIVWVNTFAILCFVIGNILVLSSMWKLGVTGTYLGDYFGILMSHRVTSFPFNIMENPMYNGSVMCFVGTALWNGSGAGLLISIWVWFVYKLALAYEGPFTAQIYAKRNQIVNQKQS